MGIPCSRRSLAEPCIWARMRAFTYHVLLSPVQFTRGKITCAHTQCLLAQGPDKLVEARCSGLPVAVRL